MKNGIVIGAAMAGAMLVSGCATERAPGELIADPYVETNRSIHEFNKGLDSAVLKPVSEVYGSVTPDFLQQMISNELKHLQLPGIFINRVLQADVDRAGVAVGRFGVNTILGIGGLFDPATDLGLPFEPTDFGVTLATWGVDEGVYHELPFFGPATTRSAVGRVVNFALDPTILLTAGVVEAGQVVSIVAQARTPVEIVNARHENAELIDDVFYRSEDSYVTARTGFVQNRRRVVSDGETDTEELPDIFSEE